MRSLELHSRCGRSCRLVVSSKSHCSWHFPADTNWRAAVPAVAMISLKALATETFIFYGRPHGPAFYEATIAACHAAGFSPRVGQEAPRITSTLSLVAAGLGIAVVPASLQRMNMDGVTYRHVKARLRIAGTH